MGLTCCEAYLVSPPDKTLPLHQLAFWLASEVEADVSSLGPMVDNCAQTATEYVMRILSKRAFTNANVLNVIWWILSNIEVLNENYIHKHSFKLL